MGDQFPAGLRVLVVDDDRTCLAILKKMLLSCAYNVTTCGMARLALAMLRENKERFDVVLSDVYMPDMDGFKLLELVGLEMDLPVIMMSADGETSLVMKGITHGACDYLLKPIRIKELKNIWQHVIRKKRNILRDVDGSDHDKHKRKSEEGDSMSSKKRRDSNDDDDEADIDESSALKKPRVVWSVELHQQFVSAVNQLGIDKAVPKRILELMNVQGLTRENVASHLQKYRLYLKRLSVAQHQNAVNMSMEPPFAAVVDSLQTHPIITPSSSQALAALRTAYLRTLCSPPTEPVISRVEPPVFIVRPQDSHQRNLLLGDSEQLTQSQIVGSQSNSLAEQLIHQQQQHHVQLQPYKQEQEQQQQQHHIQLQQLPQYGEYKDTPNELCNRHMNEDMVNTGFILVTNGVQPVSKGGIQPCVGSMQPCVNTSSVVKCEQPDSLGGWEYPQQLNSWQQEVQQTDYPPYRPPASDMSYRTVDVTYNAPPASDVLQQRPEYFIGNNSFKVKQEHVYDPVVIPGQFAAAAHVQQELAGLQPYKQDPDSSYFDNEIGLEGYVPAGNVYVK